MKRRYCKLDEVTRKELLFAASPEPWRLNIKTRASGYSLVYKGLIIDPDKNIFDIHFSTNPPPGHTVQHQVIRLMDFWDIFMEEHSKENPMPLRQIINLAIMDGDVKISCSCPSWIYGGYKFMATKMDYNLGAPENRFPIKKNPKLQGTMCKHLFVALSYLPGNMMTILSDFNKQSGNFLKELNNGNN